MADILDKERLYALACAAGCTNRAASIRNGGYRVDLFRPVSLAAKQACEFRSFEIDCDQQGAWGGAMLGQAYRNGEGVTARVEQARTAFETACRIDPNFVAFTRRQIEAMDRPPTAHDAEPDE